MCQLGKGLIVSNFSKKYKKELAFIFWQKMPVFLPAFRNFCFLNYREPETPKVSVFPEVLPPGTLSFP